MRDRHPHISFGLETGDRAVGGNIKGGLGGMEVRMGRMDTREMEGTDLDTAFMHPPPL